MITFEHRIDGVLTDATSVKLSDPDATYGLRDSETHDVLIADGTALTHNGTGLYSIDPDDYDVDEERDYDYWLEVLYDNEFDRVQKTIHGSGSDTEFKKLRFVVVGPKDDDPRSGEYKQLASLPRLESPTEFFGVKDLDSGDVIVNSGVAYLFENKLYTASFADQVEQREYLYYVKLTVNDVVQYVYANTSYVSSANFVYGRYTNSLRIANMFGADNVHTWLNSPNSKTDEPIDYALRQWQFIEDAEREIDSKLAGSFFRGDGEDFTENGVPGLIASLATTLAGLLTYESNGVINYDEQSNAARHRLRWHRENYEKLIKQLRNGVVRLDGSGIGASMIPKFYASCGVEKIRDNVLDTL